MQNQLHHVVGQGSFRLQSNRAKQLFAIVLPRSYVKKSPFSTTFSLIRYISEMIQDRTIVAMEDEQEWCHFSMTLTSNPDLNGKLYSTFIWYDGVSERRTPFITDSVANTDSKTTVCSVDNNVDAKVVQEAVLIFQHGLVCI